MPALDAIWGRIRMKMRRQIILVSSCRAYVVAGRLLIGCGEGELKRSI